MTQAKVSENKVSNQEAHGSMPVEVDGTGGDVGEAKQRRVAAYQADQGPVYLRPYGVGERHA